MAKQLTERQQEIVNLLDAGKTPGEAAKELGITENAVYQHIRRMRANGSKISTSGSGSPRPARRRPAAAKPTPPRPAAPAPSEPRLMTPLQAIRARKDALAHEVREAANAASAAERAMKVAHEAAEKVRAKHGEELKALERAEAAITGRPVIKAAKRTQRKPATGNGSAPAAEQTTPTASTPDPAAV